LLSVFLTILPVFLVLGAGYFVGRIKYLPDSVADGLNTYAVKLAVPVLLFMAMYRLDLAQAFHIGMLISFYAGAIFCFVSGIILARLIWKRRPGEAVAVGFCAVFSNTVLIGLPIAQLAFGEGIAQLAFGEGIMTQVFGIIALHASFLYSMGMTTMEFARQDGRGLSETLKASFYSVMANPLMVGIIAGLLMNLSSIELFAQLEQALEMIRTTAIPVALIGIGIALNRYKISSAIPETMMVTVLALGFHPAIAFLLSHYVFELEAIYVQAAVLLAAMPPGMNIYIFANLYNRALGLSASVLVITNFISIFTIPIWLTLIKSL